ncbi:hypothetical protein COLO4_14526 [Corchorus olitorius]|uniref:Uncharacterized protein n=1 Tax=Corchorus olitorius TaxID=93759 RepID=A0A1R3JRP4_9ROSI|nr:hypothetical protein COLO4_14526 [Corchorus olitorius]
MAMAGPFHVILSCAALYCIYCSLPKQLGVFFKTKVGGIPVDIINIGGDSIDLQYEIRARQHQPWCH